MPFASEAQRDYEVMIEGDDRGGSVAVMARVKVVNVGTFLVAKFYMDRETISPNLHRTL